ncbi:hypothetical protein T439DRAFT_383539 [Meredithblackwellia eburnea MCA 4105]
MVNAPVPAVTTTIATTDLEAILRRLTRLEDEKEIEKLMAHRAYLHSAGRHDVEHQEMWSKREDIIFEPEDWGGWTGHAAMEQNYVKANPFPPSTKGLMIEHTVTTGIIEIADDRQTAKGVWISPGHETFPMGDGLPKPHWSWGRYGVDFVREDGQWKIWHLHVLTTFRTPFDKSWVETAISRPDYLPEEGTAMPGMLPPDRAVSFNQPYHPDKNPKYQPVPPEPYKSWKDTFSCVDPYTHPREVSQPV